MALTKIEWAHFTFNPWRGCTKVSDGCKNCYADKQSQRNPGTLGVWGKNGTREHAAESYMALPFKWDAWARDGVCYACGGKGSVKKKAKRGAVQEPNLPGIEGETPVALTTKATCDVCSGSGKLEPMYRLRVFCASMADVHEGADTLPDGMAETIELWRDELHATIALTRNLDWLLLTKRTGHARRYYEGLADPEVRAERLDPHISAQAIEHSNCHARTKTDLRATAPLADEMEWPLPNLWLGASVEDQKAAAERIPDLLATPAVCRFLSVEPLLGPVKLTDIRGTKCLASSPASCCGDQPWVDALRGIQGCKRAGAYSFPNRDEPPRGLDWIIVGGESGGGPKIRPMHPAWARSLRDQCVSASVPFLFKQWGEWTEDGRAGSQTFDYRMKPQPLMPSADDDCVEPRCAMRRVGKEAAGRLLDGRTWDEVPFEKVGK